VNIYQTIHNRPCSCDVDLVAAVDVHPIMYPLLHVGTGGHHYVGRHISKKGGFVTGLTTSIWEDDTYKSLMIMEPSLCTGYRLMFADCYAMQGFEFGPYQTVTLFHLCEYYNPVDNDYALGGDVDLVRRIVGGRTVSIVLFVGSTRYKDARFILNGFDSTKEWTHGSIESYRVRRKG
jgi:hypothetical protein